MKYIILFVGIFLVVMYILMYSRQNKRRKENEINAVDEFRSNYIDRREEMKKRREMRQGNANYITKYNSSEDYREK